jgi:hypothetical protein
MKKIILLLFIAIVFKGCASTAPTAPMVTTDYMGQMEQRKAFLKTIEDQLLIEENYFISTLTNDQRETLKKWETIQPTQEEFNKAWNTLDQKQQTKAANLIRRRAVVEQEKKAINIGPTQSPTTEYFYQMYQRKAFLDTTESQLLIDENNFENTLDGNQTELLKRAVLTVSPTQGDVNNFVKSLDEKKQIELASLVNRRMAINQEKERIETGTSPQTPTQTTTKTVGFWDVLSAILSNVHGAYWYGYPSQTYQEQQNQQILFNQILIQNELNRIRNQQNPPKPLWRPGQ